MALSFEQFQQLRSQGLSPEQIAGFEKGNTPPTEATKPPRDLGNTLANVADATIGGGQMARGIGMGLGSIFSKDVKNAQASQNQLGQSTQKYVQHALATYPIGDPRRAKALTFAGGAYQNVGQNAQAATGSENAPTNKQILGSAGQLAGTAIAAKIPTGKGLFRTETMGAAKIPVQGIAQQIGLSKVPQSLGLGLLTGASSKYGQTGGEGLGVNPEQAKQIARNAATTGLTGGALALGTGLIGKLFSALTQKAPERLANSALGVTKAQQKGYQRSGLPSLGQRALDMNIPAGNPEDIATWATEQSTPLQSQLNDFINQKQARGKTVSGKELKSYLGDLMKAAKNTPGEEGTYQAFRDMAKGIKNQYNLPQLQELKSNLQSAARKSYGKPFGGNIADAQKALAYGARNKLEQATTGLPIPQTVFEQLTPKEQELALAGKFSPINRINKSLQTLGQIQDSIQGKAASEMTRQPIGYRDILGATLGTVAGHPLAAADVIVGGHLARTAHGQLFLAKLLQKLGKPTQGAIAQGVNKAGKIGLSQSLGKLFAGQ